MKEVVQAIKAEIQKSKDRISEEQKRIDTLSRTIRELEPGGRPNNRRATSKTRRARPSDLAVSAGLVTSGGRFRDIRGQVMKVLNESAGAMTTEQVGKAIYQPGLGIKKSDVIRRTGIMLSVLKREGIVAGAKGKGKGFIWTAAKA